MLTADQMAQRIAQVLGPGNVLEVHAEGLHPWLAVGAENWLAVARFLRDDSELQLGLLRCLTGIDYPDRHQLCVAYDLMSFERGHEICVKVFIARAVTPPEEAKIPSVADVWRAADWHEREAYDLFGIVFTDHPDSVEDEGGVHPRRILLPEDWEGFPLRKDYIFPREYHGIPGTVETDWAQKVDYPH